MPVSPSKLDTCLPFTLMGARCVRPVAYLSPRKQSAEFLPPTHICGFTSHEQMENKRAAGMLGSRGALTRPRGFDTAALWAAGSQAAQPTLPASGHCPRCRLRLNTREGIPETLRSGNEAQNSRFIKIAISSFIEQMLVGDPSSCQLGCGNPSPRTRFRVLKKNRFSS